MLQTERKAQQGGAPVYSYRLMWRTPVDGGRRLTPHSLDLPFVFDNVAFARTGDPNNSSVGPWAPYDLGRRNVMLFDLESAALDDPHGEERLAMSRYPTQQAAGRLIHR